MADQPDLTQKMFQAAVEASQLAAGRVLGERIAAAHPGLPPVRWTADRELDRTWTARGMCEADDDDDVRRTVEAYAKALGGEVRFPERNPRMSGAEVETRVSFEGIPITVWGVLLNA